MRDRRGRSSRRDGTHSDSEGANSPRARHRGRRGCAQTCGDSQYLRARRHARHEALRARVRIAVGSSRDSPVGGRLRQSVRVDSVRGGARRVHRVDRFGRYVSRRSCRRDEDGSAARVTYRGEASYRCQTGWLHRQRRYRGHAGLSDAENRRP